MFPLPFCTSTLGRTLGHPKVALCPGLRPWGPGCPASATLFPSWSKVRLWISSLQAAGAWDQLVGLRVSGCQGMQGTGPSSSWLGYPDAIPCLQNISLPVSAPGQHNLPSASAAGWTLGWLLGCGMGFRAQPWDMLQLSMHGHGQLVTGLTVLWGFGPRGASESPWAAQSQQQCSPLLARAGRWPVTALCQWYRLGVTVHCGCTLLPLAWGCRGDRKSVV